ncbi:AEC family transporter [Phaeobacter marinintestinus]|uniref:AEC family transporter n=1 Tax=Falsiphaeobacter marinintestinus TaxID=1492905 RepID=UPI0011B49CCB|nr:AEC family transporter [Phaeobacter marinintestinus]
MDLALTVAEIVAPVFLLAGIGFAWVKLGFEYRLEFVTRLGMTLAVPSLVFVALMQLDVERQSVTSLLLAALVAHGAILILSFVVLRLLNLDRRTYLSPMIFGNTGNVGLPLALFAFGETGLGLAVVVFAVTAIGTFTVGLRLVAGQGSFLKILTEPMVAATLLGGLFLWQGWTTPVFLTNTLELLGQMAIPLMLITLGVAVARLTPGSLGRSVWISLLKLVICVAVAWGVGRAFGLDDAAFGVLVLQMSTPVAVTAFLLAEKYNADSTSVAGLVVISTVMSVASLPVILALLL